MRAGDLCAFRRWPSATVLHGFSLFPASAAGRVSKSVKAGTEWRRLSNQVTALQNQLLGK
jgi:hypothetical protein